MREIQLNMKEYQALELSLASKYRFSNKTLLDEGFRNLELVVDGEQIVRFVPRPYLGSCVLEKTIAIVEAHRKGEI